MGPPPFFLFSTPGLPVSPCPSRVRLSSSDHCLLRFPFHPSHRRAFVSIASHGRTRSSWLRPPSAPSSRFDACAAMGGLPRISPECVDGMMTKTEKETSVPFPGDATPSRRVRGWRGRERACVDRDGTPEGGAGGRKRSRRARRKGLERRAGRGWRRCAAWWRAHSAASARRRAAHGRFVRSRRRR